MIFTWADIAQLDILHHRLTVNADATRVGVFEVTVCVEVEAYQDRDDHGVRLFL